MSSQSRASGGLNRRQFLATGALATTLVLKGKGVEALAPSERLNVGFVGVGGRGTALLGYVLKNKNARVVAVCDIDQAALDRAAKTVEEVGGTKPETYLDYRALLSNTSVNVVFSATPCDVHYQVYMDTIAAEKHLYGEKPMCLSAQQANDLVAQQEKHPKVKVQIGLQRRCNPRFVEGVRLIRKERILGELIEGRAAYNNSWTPKGGLGGPGSWQSQKIRSGDWMLEQAVHAWDVLNWVAGSTPLRAFGLGNHKVFQGSDPKRNVTDYYCAILEYPNNLVVQFSHSWISPKDPAFDGAYVRFAGLYGGIDLGAGKIIYNEQSKRESRVHYFEKEVQNMNLLSTESFVDCVLNDRTPRSTVYNGRDATLVGLLVRKAVYERRVVTWEEIVQT